VDKHPECIDGCSNLQGNHAPCLGECDLMRDALQTLLDAVEGNRVTVGDCIQARKALGAV
jgi:hypothetical protein